MNEDENFIQNNYKSDKVNWQILKFEMKTKLMHLVKQLCEKIDILSVNSIRVDGKQVQDASIYSGSSGVLWALFKYIQMLKNEMVRYYEKGAHAEAKQTKKEAQATEIRLMRAIQRIMRSLKVDKKAE